MFLDKKTINFLDKTAKTHGVSVDKVVGIMHDASTCEQAQQDARRSSPDEKEKIEAGIRKMFEENPNVERPPIKEIAKELGVRVNQGNLSRISRQMKVAALTYQKAAE